MIKKIITIFDKLRRHGRSYFLSFQVDKISKNQFQLSLEEARKLYKHNKDTYNFSDYLVPQWKANTEAIETFFLRSFNFDFLRHPVIRQTMFFEMPDAQRKIQIDFLEQHYSSHELAVLLKEIDLGKPILSERKYCSSGNTIHHLYHIAKFEHETKKRFSDFSYVVELGGGFGNFARLIKRINPEATIIIIDIPIFSFIQYIYLRTILGAENVCFYADSEAIPKGKIVLFPMDTDSLKKLPSKISGGLFVSTWALSESNNKTQQIVKELNYFNADYLLFAYQKSSEQFQFAEDVTNMTSHFTAIYNAETTYIPNNYYLFAKRS